MLLSESYYLHRISFRGSYYRLYAKIIQTDLLEVNHRMRKDATKGRPHMIFYGLVYAQSPIAIQPVRKITGMLEYENLGVKPPFGFLLRRRLAAYFAYYYSAEGVAVTRRFRWIQPTVSVSILRT